MKNLIYQYWDGNILSGVVAGAQAMEHYANMIGAEYLFELNPHFVTNLGKYSPHYGSFKPIYTDAFHEYDNVLYADVDIFPIHGLEENIFEVEFDELGICTEPYQPLARLKSEGHINGLSDIKWAKEVERVWGVSLPRTTEDLYKVYNSGVVLYSNAGLKWARKNFINFKTYYDIVQKLKISQFYQADQNYLHAMLEASKINYTELDNGWNSYVHFIGKPDKKGIRKVNDMRTPNTKFVHIQLSSSSTFNVQKLWRITNLLEEDWQL